MGIVILLGKCASRDQFFLLYWLYWVKRVFDVFDMLFSFCPFIFISWRLITLQYCSGFCHTWTGISHGFTCVPHPDPPLCLPLHPISSGSSQCTRPEHLSHASNLGWWSVSPLIVCLFQCCFLWTSHPHFLLQSLKVCSVHLYLFFVLHIGLLLPSF